MTWEMAIDIIGIIVTPAVGAIAYFIYRAGKRSEKRNAAIIIIMDIRHSEQIKLSIQDYGRIDKTIKDILPENNWSKYRHLFASDLSYDDFLLFNRFFQSCEDISDARKRMETAFYSSITEKSAIIQRKIFDIEDLSTAAGQKEREKIIDVILPDTFWFDPDEPKQRVHKNLQSMGDLSTTIAFKKLKQIAKLN